VLPVKHREHVIACLNIASHRLEEVPPFARRSLETIANQIGHALAGIRSREALREREETFRAIAENNLDTVMRFDQECRHLYVNPMVVEQTGLQTAAFIGKTHAELGFSQELCHLWEDAIRRVFRTRQLARVEFQLPRGFWIDWLLMPEFDAAGEVKAVITAGRDITERKRAEEASRRGTDFRSLVTRLLGRFASCGGADVDVCVNDGLGEIARFMGADGAFVNQYSSDQRSRGITHAWSSAGTSDVKERHQTAAAGSLPWVEGIVRKGGSVRIDRLDDLPPTAVIEREECMRLGVHSFLAVPLGGRGRVMGSLSLLARRPHPWEEHDTTQVMMVAEAIANVLERKGAEQALGESEEKFRTIFELAPFGIAIRDVEGLCLDVNTAMCEITRTPREKLIGMPWPGPFRLEDSTPEAAATRRPPDQDALRNVVLTLEDPADKRRLHWLSSSRAINLAGTPGVVSVIVDLTVQRHLEEQLQQAMKMEAIGRLAGGVAHDFNNLLTSIKANTDIALMDLPPDNSVVECLKEVEHAANSAASLTRQLLAFARRQVIEARPIDLNELVRNLRKMLVRVIGEDITLTTVEGEALGTVRVDPGQIEQALVNLAVNARDAMPHGGHLVIETANVELDADYLERHPGVAPGPYVRLAVSDTGQGMTAEVQGRLFEPFFTTKERGRGSGLGLATTYGAIKQLGGTIDVYSEVGRGSTFKIYLPRVSDPTTALPVRPPPKGPPPGGHEVVLVVEDEEAVRVAAVRILMRLGYHVLEAANGPEALALAEAHRGHIHLLVTDVVMPGMNGRELADRLTERLPKLRVLYTSGYAQNVIVHHGVVDENLHFLPKPYSPQALAEKVREALDA
jgi:two-component system, cell cycle sensor histidine kinase and response regulator CckA